MTESMLVTLPDSIIANDNSEKIKQFHLSKISFQTRISSSDHLKVITRNINICFDCIDFFNVIVLIQATDQLITMLCHVIKNYGWQKHFRFH